MANNLFDQAPYALRGENDARIATLTTDLSALDARLDTAEAELALIDSGAWIIHTPTLTQSGAVTKTVNYSSYQRIGRGITWTFVLTATGAGTANNRVLLGLPVNAAASTVSPYVGGGGLYDSSTGTLYLGQWSVFNATTMGLQSQVGDLWGVLPNLALGAGDVLKGTITYEAAS